MDIGIIIGIVIGLLIVALLERKTK